MKYETLHEKARLLEKLPSCCACSEYCPRSLALRVVVLQDCPNPMLLRFIGRPDELSPKVQHPPSPAPRLTCLVVPGLGEAVVRVWAPI